MFAVVFSSSLYVSRCGGGTILGQKQQSWRWISALLLSSSILFSSSPYLLLPSHRTISHVANAYEYNPLSHIRAAHFMWSKIVRKGDICIDATCGNGKDSVILAGLALHPQCGKLYCIDIQQKAIDQTRERLLREIVGRIQQDNGETDMELDSPNLVMDRIEFITASHETFPTSITPESVTLICYNLGYLPGNKPKELNEMRTSTDDIRIHITSEKTTLASLQNALPLIKKGGLLSVTAYPGHVGGREETDAVQSFFTQLDPLKWHVHAYCPLNRPLSPSLFSAYRIPR